MLDISNIYVFFKGASKHRGRFVNVEGIIKYDHRPYVDIKDRPL